MSHKSRSLTLLHSIGILKEYERPESHTNRPRQPDINIIITLISSYHAIRSTSAEKPLQRFREKEKQQKWPQTVPTLFKPEKKQHPECHFRLNENTILMAPGQ